MQDPAHTPTVSSHLSSMAGSIPVRIVHNISDFLCVCCICKRHSGVEPLALHGERVFKARVSLSLEGGGEGGPKERFILFFSASLFMSASCLFERLAFWTMMDELMNGWDLWLRRLGKRVGSMESERAGKWVGGTILEIMK